MMNFKYTAIGRDGKKVSGIVEAIDEIDAIRRIKMDYDVIVKVKSEEQEKQSIWNMEIGSTELNLKTLSMMCSQFSIILKSGIPISRAVNLIAGKTTDKRLKKVLKKVGKDVEAGKGLADSFQDRGEKMFPPIFIETLRAGENSGNIERSFESMYVHYDKQMKIRSKVTSALSYPVFVLVVSLVVVVVLMVKVIPTFTGIFDEFGADLPLITKILIAVSDFFRKNLRYMLLFLAAAFLGYKVYTSTEDGKKRVAKAMLKIPVLGNISQLSVASEYSNNMATLLGAGLHITNAIRVTAKVLGNYYVSQEVGKMARKLEEGHSLGDSMKESDCLPDILNDMVAVGEETGELEQTLSTIGGYYEAELDSAIQSLLSKMEPTMLVFIAGIAGFIVLAVYIAMFRMYQIM